ncbi:hypothetical protein NM688_g4448 [Phlebia brevispora]|uniref:Uncharacterized protein n=1 Tax=Phlebia brevispora TaxID=194682 RepID=A0ACC1T2X4_9APHY|nr:hypothetical protein NM688_g4448 [Phlebia brevispora]
MDELNFGDSMSPNILSKAWSTLTLTLQSFHAVQYRRGQIELLLNRCRDILQQLTTRLQDDRDTLTDLGGDIKGIEAACDSVQKIVDIVIEKGFVWCLMHPENIENQIRDSEHRVESLFDITQRIIQLDRARQMDRARSDDEEHLSRSLQKLAEDDSHLIESIQDQDGAHRTVQELTLAILKHVQNLSVRVDSRPETAFLQKAAKVLCRSSGIRENGKVSTFALSSIEVEFNVNCPIGRGASGQVYKGDWNGAVVAVKRLHADDARIISDEQKRGIRHEVKIWSMLHHPNVLTFYGACLEATVPFLVMRYCPFGDVCHYLDKHPDADRTKLSREVALGLAFLHDNGIVHADVKGANVLISEDHHALLSDFGLALKLFQIRSQSSYSIDIDRRRGTLLWMAPEVLEGRSPDMAADVYSLGLTVWEIFSGEVPFNTYLSPELLIDGVVTRNKRPDRPPRLLDDHVWKIVQRCWMADPAMRPASKEVQVHLRSTADHTQPQPEAPRMSTVLDNFFSTLIATHSSRAIETRPITLATEVAGASSRTAPIPSPSQSVVSAISTPRVTLVSATPGRAVVSNPESEIWLSIIQTLPPQWKHAYGDAESRRMQVEGVTFPFVLAGKPYTYRVINGDTDLGVVKTRPLNSDGSQSVDFLEYNAGKGIDDKNYIKVFVVDPETNENILLAKWDPHSKHPPNVDNGWSLAVRQGKVSWVPDATRKFINAVILARVPHNKFTRFRVFSGDDDLGVHVAYASQPEGPLELDFLKYTKGRGIPAQLPIKVFVVEGPKETFIAGLWE